MHSLNVSLKHFQKYQTRIRTKKQWFSAVVSRSHWKAPFCYELALTVTSCFTCKKLSSYMLSPILSRGWRHFPHFREKENSLPGPPYFCQGCLHFYLRHPAPSLYFFVSLKMTSGTPYIGTKISLISKSEIRYEGILYAIDTKEATVTLASG